MAGLLVDKEMEKPFRRMSGNCLVCSQAFVKKMGGGQIKYGPPKFCSKICHGKHLSTQAFARNKFKTFEAYLNKLLRVNERKAIAERNKQTKLEKQAKQHRQCKQCSGAVGYVFGRGKLFCSKLCNKEFSKAQPEAKEQKKAHKNKREALKRGATHGDTVKPLNILLRDGWHCKLCGIETPQTKRGLMVDDAPELDHIIPLSKGGSHTEANLQTLCRKCNGWKSSKILTEEDVAQYLQSLPPRGA